MCFSVDSEKSFLNIKQKVSLLDKITKPYNFILVEALFLWWHADTTTILFQARHVHIMLFIIQ